MTFLTRLIGILCAAALAVATLSAPADAAIPTPDEDAFYKAPSNLSTLRPGSIIRKRPVALNLVGHPALGGIPLVTVNAFQIMVRSNDAKSRPAAVIATVVVPKYGKTSGRNLLAYQPATDSLGAHCEPSYGMRTGEEKETAVIALAAAQGWAIVVPDHQGPRHAYAAGRMAGHAVLDSIRGALKMPEAQVSGAATKVAMVGYSGGAIATGWAAQLHPTYAKEINLVGVASGGTPGDVEPAGDLMDGGPFSGLFLGAAIGVAREYPELLTLLNEKGRAFAKDVANDCQSDLLLKHPFTSIKDLSDHPDPLRSSTAQAVLKANRMGSLAPTAPVYLWHSLLDELIPHKVGVKLAKDWCARGVKVQFVTDYTSEHVTGAFTGLPAAMSFLINRFAGKTAPSNC